MFWKTREVDGEPELTGLGCLAVTLFLPITLLYALIAPSFKKTEPSTSPKLSRKQRQRSLDPDGLARRQHRYFFKKSGISPEAFWLTESQYNTLKIPKATGGHRKLSMPNQDLKEVQKKIALFVERHHPRCHHKTANGFVRGRNTVTNATPHLGCEVLIKLDVKDFFDSIDPKSLLTHVERAVDGNTTLAERIIELCTFNDGLPQGAPSSPILSNIYMWNFDRVLYKICSHMGAKYTRYADDITLSLREDNRTLINCLIYAVEEQLAEHGLTLNRKPQKLQILRKHQAQRICGITINSGKTTISRKQRRLLRAAKHRQSLGLEATLGEAQLSGWQAYINSVQEPTA